MTTFRRRLSGALGCLPRSDFHDHPPPGLDPGLAVLVVKTGPRHLAHIGVSVVRSIGRGGAPVAAIVEDRLTPLALSHDLDRAVVWPTTGLEDPSELLAGLVGIGARLPWRRPLVVCTDDEAAVLVAEHREELIEHFVLPDVPPGLPRRLASKATLHELCLLHGVSTPRTRYVTTLAEAKIAASELSYPLVAKSSEPFARMRPGSPNATTRIDSEEDLERLAAGWADPFELVMQEYLPTEEFEDWFAQGYVDREGRLAVAFTARKLRAGGTVFSHATALAVLESHPGLRAMLERFVLAVGYRGIFDTDWRVDSTTGKLDLVDFNPRAGAQFRLYESDEGVDVVRAMHLDLSGREVEVGAPRDGDSLVVENLVLAGALERGWTPTRHVASPGGPGKGRMARRPRGTWFMPDDPLPALALAARQTVASLQGRVFAPDRGRPKRAIPPVQTGAAGAAGALRR